MPIIRRTLTKFHNRAASTKVNECVDIEVDDLNGVCFFGDKFDGSGSGRTRVNPAGHHHDQEGVFDLRQSANNFVWLIHRVKSV
jgi:hypothetical protein